MTLNNVVFPAPFGPIRPAICPASIENERPSSATIPPNVTDTASTLKMGIESGMLCRVGWSCGHDHRSARRTVAESLPCSSLFARALVLRSANQTSQFSDDSVDGWRGAWTVLIEGELDRARTSFVARR